MDSEVQELLRKLVAGLNGMGAGLDGIREGTFYTFAFLLLALKQQQVLSAEIIDAALTMAAKGPDSAEGRDWIGRLRNLMNDPRAFAGRTE